MCIGCDWSAFRNLLVQDGKLTSGVQSSRRQVLQASAILATAGLIPARQAIAQATQSPRADIVFRGGAIYTVNQTRPWAQAVAIRDKHIVFVGTNGEAEAFVGPGTRVVDLAGKMLLPGFVEGHIHPAVGAVMTRGLDLQYDTRDKILEVLRTYRDQNAGVAVVRGFGWRYHAFPEVGPNKRDLDALWPDTPVILIAIDGHGAWVNSKALDMAGITRATKDPIPGFSHYQRDPATGEPTGYVVEPPAIFPVVNAVSPFTADYIAQSLEELLPSLSAAGITSLFDAGLVILPEDVGFQVYANLERKGKLPARIVGAYYHNNAAVDPLPIIKSLRQQFNSELLKVSILKLNMDGGDAQRTAAMLAPYSDDPKSSGDTLLPPDVFFDIVRRADRDGIDIHVHSYGDRATRLSLDAIEGAIKANPPRDRRNALAHLLLISPEDQPRFAQLGVTAQFSAQWAVPDVSWSGITLKRFGADRANSLYCLNTLLKSGCNLSLGTDWPAAGYYSTNRPLDAIEIATTRRELNKPEQIPLAPAEERVTLDQALRASTLGPAYQLGMERSIGSIEVGKLADLVVLEKNLFDLPPSDIHKTKIVMTMMNGQVRHG